VANYFHKSMALCEVTSVSLIRLTVSLCSVTLNTGGLIRLVFAGAIVQDVGSSFLRVLVTV